MALRKQNYHKQTPNTRKRLSKNQFWEVMEKNGGVYAATARAITEIYGVPMSRQAVRDRALKDPDKLKEIEEGVVDIAEGTIIKLMSDTSSPEVARKSSEFYLKTKGKHRGYVESIEQHVESFNMNLGSNVDLDKLSPEALMEVKRAFDPEKYDREH